MKRVVGLLVVMTSAAVSTAVAQTEDVNPVGTYEFRTYANNQWVSGTLKISENGEGKLVAVLDAPSAGIPVLTSSSVGVEGKDITVRIPYGPEGDIWIEVTLEGDDITGQWALGMDGGDITGKRVKRGEGRREGGEG